MMQRLLFDVVANRVLAIVQQSAEGADPETADYSQSSCSGAVLHAAVAADKRF